MPHRTRIDCDRRRRDAKTLHAIASALASPL
jgi:hypothetical protein